MNRSAPVLPPPAQHSAPSTQHLAVPLALALALLLAALAGTAAAQTITTVAGTGTQGFAGDGGPATSARLAQPNGVAVDGSGNAFIADTLNHAIRKVAAGTGVITTLAGTGTLGFMGDGGPAGSARLNNPSGVAVDASGNVFVADASNHRVRRVAAGTGVITTVAGTGLSGGGGDGGPAVSAQLSFPTGVAVDASGNVFIADRYNHRVRRIAAGTGTITTVAGSSPEGFGGDGGLATSAQLLEPVAVAVDASGNLSIVDSQNHRIRRVAAGTGIITTVAGSGPTGAGMGAFAGDGGSATSARLSFPFGVGLDASGNVYIADALNHRIRRVAAGTGVITTVAGSGPTGSGLGGDGGDGGPATSALLNEPSGLAFDVTGNLFIADANNHRIRRVAGAALGTRSTITAPAPGSRFTRPAPVTFTWTAVAGAASYGFEYTSPGRQFANPNGTGPDAANGFGGTGGGLVVSGTSLPITLTASVPAGTYQVRVIGLSAASQIIGTFSDAVTIVVQ